MPFSQKSRFQIRDGGLGYLSARFSAIGRRISTIKASFFYTLFDVLGLLLEGYEQRGATLGDAVFPDTAGTDDLNHHGAVEGLPRKFASAAVIQVAITGTASATLVIGVSSQLGAPNGLAFVPCDANGVPVTSVLLDGGGKAAIHAKCTTAGSAGNLTTGAVLTWSSAPAGAGSTGTVVVLHKVSITGTASATVTFGSNKLKSTNSILYAPVDAAGNASTGTTLDGAGHATIYAKCQSNGVSGVQPAGAVLTWSPSTPASLNATGSVQSGFGPVTGADDESDPEYAARILERRQERPGSGNRSDFRSWGEAVSNVREVYVYPLCSPTLGAGTPGCVTLAIMGAAPEPPFTGATSRTLTAADAARVQAYLDGTQDAQGNAVAVEDQVQLRPVTIDYADVSVVIPAPTSQPVDMTVTVSSIGVPVWAAQTTDAGSTAALLVLTADPVAAGLAVNDFAAVENPSARGGFEYFRIASLNAGAKTVGVATDTPLLTAPAAGRAVRVATSNAADIRDAILRVFDSLGPCDLATPTRWPAAAQQGPSTLFRSALVGAVQTLPGLPGAPAGVRGVAGVSLTTPAADVAAPAAGSPPTIAVLVPDTITLTFVAA